MLIEFNACGFRIEEQRCKSTREGGLKEGLNSQSVTEAFHLSAFTLKNLMRLSQTSATTRLHDDSDPV